MAKWLKVALIAVPLLVIAAAAVVFWRIDAIVRSTVEAETSAQLNVPATLKSADVGILRGTLDLRDFELGSPRGFSAPHMLKLGGADVQVSYRELMHQPVRIASITLDRPTLVIEQKDLVLNFKALVDGMPPAPPGNKPSEPVKLIIDRTQITGAKVIIRPGLPGVLAELAMEIPPIDIANIGNADNAQNGAAIREVVLTMVTALANAAAENDKLPSELRLLLRGQAQQIIDEKLKGVQAEIGQAIEKIAKDPTKIDQVGKELEQGLKGLVPGVQKKEKKNPGK